MSLRSLRNVLEGGLRELGSGRVRVMGDRTNRPIRSVESEISKSEGH